MTDAPKAWKQLRRVLGLLEHFEGDTVSFSLEDCDRLEKAFPGCSVALDHHPRIMKWKNFRFSLMAKREMRHVPEDGWGGLLVAYQANEHGAYVNTPTEAYVRMGAKYFVEQAVFVPSIPQWVVIR